MKTSCYEERIKMTFRVGCRNIDAKTEKISHAFGADRASEVCSIIVQSKLIRSRTRKLLTDCGQQKGKQMRKEISLRQQAYISRITLRFSYTRGNPSSTKPLIFNSPPKLNVTTGESSPLNAHTENATRRILPRDACNSAVSQKNLESTQIQSFCSCTTRQRSVVDIFLHCKQCTCRFIPS